LIAIKGSPEVNIASKSLLSIGGPIPSLIPVNSLMLRCSELMNARMYFLDLQGHSMLVLNVRIRLTGPRIPTSSLTFAEITFLAKPSLISIGDIMS
jgi:hypothetical protein